MRKLIGKTLTLALLIACLIFIPAPQRTRADWASCDADLSARNDFCTAQYNQCIASQGPNCQENYDSCRDQAAKIHHDFTQTPATGCIFENAPDPLPLPMIDTSRSDCMATCQEGADQIEDGVEQFHYLVECNNYCDEHYPKP